MDWVFQTPKLTRKKSFPKGEHLKPIVLLNLVTVPYKNIMSANVLPRKTRNVWFVKIFVANEKA